MRDDLDPVALTRRLIGVDSVNPALVPGGAGEAALTEAHRATTGAPPLRRGEPFWTDCALLHAVGIDTVLFGVDGGGAHAAREWVSVASVHTLTRTLASTATAYTA